MSSKLLLRGILFSWVVAAVTVGAEEVRVKAPNVSGAFYPADPGSLRGLVRVLLSRAPEVAGDVTPKILIVPHAGYVYSGQTAADGYKAIEDRSYDTVILLGASHFFPYAGAALYGPGVFRTPLGDVKVDEVLSQSWVESAPDLFVERPDVFEREHSIEVQLPFLQTLLDGGFDIVPVLLGDVSFSEVERLAHGIARALKKGRVLVVVSTDMSHYRPLDEADELDKKSIEFIRAGDAKGLWEAVVPTGWNVCAAKAVAAALLAAREISADTIRVLGRSTSADATHDPSRVVGYASVLIGTKEVVMLTQQDKMTLLKIARSAIEARLERRSAPDISADTPGLGLRRGAFVTLGKKGALRGCIGQFTSEEPLTKVVAAMAAAAAFEDPRFPPVAAGEMKDIDIEISVLSAPEPIADWRAVRLGVDGVIVRRGFSSGVFLPQVATETGWDLETFLGELCSQKAGLPRESYKDPSTKLLTFQADIFSERELM